MDRQSSLPTSLIPHLYAAPQAQDQDQDQDRSLVFIANNRHLPPVFPPSTNQSLFYRPTRSLPATTVLPPLASLSTDFFPSWRQGEAGPSSLIHPAQRNYDSHRRGSSQPPRVISPPNSPFSFGSRQDPGYYSSFPSPSNQSLYPSANPPIPPLPPLQYLERPLSFDRRDAYSYPQVGSLSISASSPPNYLGQANNSPEPDPSYHSESLSVDMGSNEGDHGHRHKKRRADSMDTDDNPKKATRKTLVACNFCRGRKLRCSGAKPSCHNCTVRKFQCEYVSTQRRRGPGKAPKGSRSRKGRSEHSGSSSKNIGDRLPLMVPDSPDLRPYTSVISLDTFGFQPPDTSPQYPSDPYSRTRTSRSRETSSEDRSDAKDIHRHQSGS